MMLKALLTKAQKEMAKCYWKLEKGDLHCTLAES